MTIIFITLAGERVETSDVKELKRRAANGEITPDTIVNVDGTPHSANKIKGLVFGTSANETPSAPSVPPETANFFLEQAVEEENAASFAPTQESNWEEEKKNDAYLAEKTIPRKAENYLAILELCVWIQAAIIGVGGLGVLCWGASREAWSFVVMGVALCVGALIETGVLFSVLGLVREHFKINAQILKKTRNLVEITENLMEITEIK
ncbi:MAG: hypothetical protein IKU86_12955 [Thermoguttaceae bacterium]|nr:hypothetical protein [Thermoguttaceae bacterium]